MAEIHVEKKQKPVWPWIVGILVILGIVWLIADGTDEPIEEGTPVVATQPGMEPMPGNADIAVEPEMNEDRTYVDFVDNNDFRDKMGEDHEATGEALIKLSSALRSLSQESAGFEEEINQVEEAGRNIQQDPESLNHANTLKNAFASAADVMGKIQAERFPDAESEVSEVQEAAAQLKADEELLNQKDEITAFFDKSADAIAQMNEEAETQDDNL